MSAALPPLPTDRPWNADEAAIYLRLEKYKNARKIVIRRVREGKLKAGRNGREYLFTKAQLDASIFVNRP